MATLVNRSTLAGAGSDATQVTATAQGENLPLIEGKGYLSLSPGWIITVLSSLRADLLIVLNRRLTTSNANYWMYQVMATSFPQGYGVDGGLSLFTTSGNFTILDKVAELETSVAGYQQTVLFMNMFVL